MCLILFFFFLSFPGKYRRRRTRSLGFLLEQDRKKFLLKMVIAGENTGKKRFTDPRIQGNLSILVIICSFQFPIFVSGDLLNFGVSVSVITEDTTDARIDSRRTV